MWSIHCWLERAESDAGDNLLPWLKWVGCGWWLFTGFSASKVTEHTKRLWVACSELMRAGDCLAKTLLRCSVLQLGINWDTRDSVWMSGSTCLLCRWRSTCMGCLERLWSLLGNIQKPSGWGPGQSALGVPAWAGIGQNDQMRLLPTSTILWFLQASVDAKILLPFLWKQSCELVMGISCTAGLLEHYGMLCEIDQPL